MVLEASALLTIALALGLRLASATNITGTQIPQGNLSQELAFAMLNAVDCQSCFALLKPLQQLAETGDEPFSDMLVETCVLFGDQDPIVCNGTIRLAAPQFARNLRGVTVDHNATKDGVTSQARQLLCSTLFGLCPFPPVPPVDVPFPSPAPAHPKEFKSKGGKPLKWLQISDVHVDRSYLPGSDSNCTLNLCCRDLGPSSVGPNVSQPAGPFGHKNCDSSPALADSLIQEALSLPDINGTLFTGDIPEGLDYQYTQKGITDDLYAWYIQSQVLSPYSTMGNHDSSPTASMTYFPRNDSQWIYDITAIWEHSIGHDAAQTAVHTSGCYAAVHPGTNLKIISMNSVLFYQHDFMNFDTDFPSWDPSGMLRFVISELQAAEDAGQRVWIIAHIPSGKADTLPAPSNYMDQIFKRYDNTIAAKFYGHSHKDQFEIGYSDYTNQTLENALGISFISGAMTPTSGNPTLRRYSIDPDTYEVMDFEPIIANTTAPGYQETPVWFRYYSARELYGPYVDPPLQPNEPLDAKFFHKLTVAFEKNETLFQQYNTALSRGGAVGNCTGACKTRVICEQRAARSENNCNPNVAGAFFNKRDADMSENSPPDPHECGGQGLHSIVRKIIGPVAPQKLNAALNKRDVSSKWHDVFLEAAAKLANR